jgi:hypothetical protein
VVPGDAVPGDVVPGDVVPGDQTATPSLMPRLRAFLVAGETALAEALAKDTDPLTARLAAAQITAVRGALLFALHEGITAGRSADELYPEAVAAANRAYDLLERGLPL